MVINPDSAVIGVDGGGSRCRLAYAAGDIRHTVETGAANISSDFDGAIKTIKSGLTALAEKADIPADALYACPAHLGLAGMMTEEDGHRAAQASGLAKVTVSGDREITAAGALGNSNGAIVSIGTGSFLARLSDGRATFVGGWGFVLGDEASGAWLGRTALTRTLHVLDGALEATGLTRALLERFGSGAAIVAFAQTAKPADFAAIGRDVVNALEGHDSLAEVLMDEGVAYILRCLRALDWNPQEPLCLIGGLADAYRDRLPAEAQNALIDPAGSALDGALRLARNHHFAEHG